MQTDDTRCTNSRSVGYLPGLCIHHTGYSFRPSDLRCVCRHAFRINDPHSSQSHSHEASLSTCTLFGTRLLRMPPSGAPPLPHATACGLPSPLLPRQSLGSIHLLVVKLARQARNSLYFALIIARALSVKLPQLAARDYDALSGFMSQGHQTYAVPLTKGNARHSWTSSLYTP
jgi:hypothetical protein